MQAAVVRVWAPETHALPVLLWLFVACGVWHPVGVYLRTWLQQVPPGYTLVAALFAASRVGIPAF